jgi:hypothetical protein
MIIKAINSVSIQLSSCAPVTYLLVKIEIAAVTAMSATSGQEFRGPAFSARLGLLSKGALANWKLGSDSVVSKAGNGRPKGLVISGREGSESAERKKGLFGWLPAGWKVRKLFCWSFYVLLKQLMFFSPYKDFGLFCVMLRLSLSSGAYADERTSAVCCMRGESAFRGLLGARGRKHTWGSGMAVSLRDFSAF